MGKYIYLTVVLFCCSFYLITPAEVQAGFTEMNLFLLGQSSDFDDDYAEDPETGDIDIQEAVSSDDADTDAEDEETSDDDVSDSSDSSDFYDSDEGESVESFD